MFLLYTSDVRGKGTASREEVNWADEGSQIRGGGPGSGRGWRSSVRLLGSQVGSEGSPVMNVVCGCPDWGWSSGGMGGPTTTTPAFMTPQGRPDLMRFDYTAKGPFTPSVSISVTAMFPGIKSSRFQFLPASALPSASRRQCRIWEKV